MENKNHKNLQVDNYMIELTTYSKNEGNVGHKCGESLNILLYTTTIVLLNVSVDKFPSDIIDH